MRTFLVCICILLIAVPSYAAEFTAGSCAYADVQSKINSASNGDTVHVPPGNCTWSSRLSIPGNKGITLRGAGIDLTTITNNTGGYLISWATSSANSLGRITGFTFDGGSGITMSGNDTDFRIDHNKFTGSGVGVLVGSARTTELFGVIDNNEVSATTMYKFVQLWNGALDTWGSASSLGSANFVYIEDNTFDFDNASQTVGLVDCTYSGAFVLRHNTGRNVFFGNHGTCENPNEGGYGRGCRQWEVYGNTFEVDDAYYRGVMLRGGTGIIYDNEWTVTSGGITHVIDVRDERGNHVSACASNGWGICDGNSSNDANDDATGYVCMDQVGSTVGAVSEPLYAWNNVYDDNFVDVTVNSGRATSYFKPERDLFNNVVHPTYTPFPYPHPLTAGMVEAVRPSPPTGFVGTKN